MSTWVKPGWQRRAFAYAIGILFAVLALNALGAHYWVGIDLQKWRCMPWVVYLVDRAPAEPIRDGYYQIEARGLMPFFKDGARFAKQLVGMPGDHVRVHKGKVEVNGTVRGWLSIGVLNDLKKPYTAFERDVVLGPNDYWLMGTLDASYDSRYWGPATRDQIRGKVYPIW